MKTNRELGFDRIARVGDYEVGMTESACKNQQKTFEFWTDGGDEDDIEADTIEEAAEIASKKIKIREWNDGAWGIVKDAETGEQMDVPSRATE